MVDLPTLGRPGAPRTRATGGGPLTASFRGTRVGKKGERLSKNQLNTSNKAWQQCGVEERWKGWQLLLRRLPAAAQSLSLHLFTHTHTQITSGSHIFFPTNPHSGTRTVWQRASRGNKKLEKIFNSRELFADFLWMDCCAPRASPQAQGQPGLDSQVRQTPALRVQSDLTHFTDGQAEALRSARWERRRAAPHRRCSLCPRPWDV